MKGKLPSLQHDPKMVLPHLPNFIRKYILIPIRARGSIYVPPTYWLRKARRSEKIDIKWTKISFYIKFSFNCSWIDDVCGFFNRLYFAVQEV